MSECLLPMMEEEWKKPPVGGMEGSLMTPLGIIEGEILTCLEEQRRLTRQRLLLALDVPAPLLTMALGALARAGLVRVSDCGEDFSVEAVEVSGRKSRIESQEWEGLAPFGERSRSHGGFLHEN